MCGNKQRSFLNCKAEPKHEYYLVDWCVEGLKMAKACDTRENETFQQGIAAPPGSHSCPYKGCSVDLRYQFVLPPSSPYFILPAEVLTIYSRAVQTQSMHPQ